MEKNPLRLLEEIVMSMKRQELYLSGLYSVELCRLGLIEKEELATIINTITEGFEADNQRKEVASWPVSQNLVA